MENHPEHDDKVLVTEKPLTDLTYLKHLSKGDESFVKEMLGIFLEENPHEIEALKKAIDNGTFQQIYAAAHKLKSSTPFVGIYDRIRPHVLKIEELAKRQENREEMLENFRFIDQICGDTRKEISAKLNDIVI